MYFVIGCGVKVYIGFKSYIFKVLINIKESSSRVIFNDAIFYYIKWNLKIQKNINISMQVYLVKYCIESYFGSV